MNIYKMWLCSKEKLEIMYFYKKLFLYILILLLFCASKVFSVERVIHIEWGYTPPSVPGVIGFKLYKEGTPSCQIMNKDAFDMDCYVTITKQQTPFTLTALFDDNTESPHSAPFIFTLPETISSTEPPVTGAPIVSTTDNKLLTFVWDATNTPDTKGYKIYMNNEVVCKTYDLSKNETSCTATVPKGTLVFNVTQVYTDNTESLFSNSLTYTE